MKKQKPIKEKIFIKNHKQKRLLEQWQKYDPITRRVLYDGYHNYKNSYYYLKISITKEYLLCSYVECRAVVFPNSEFIRNECKSFIKVFFENEKVYSKDWDNIKWRIWEFAFEKKKKDNFKYFGYRLLR